MQVLSIGFHCFAKYTAVIVTVILSISFIFPCFLWTETCHKSVQNLVNYGNNEGLATYAWGYDMTFAGFLISVVDMIVYFCGLAQDLFDITPWLDMDYIP